MNLDASLSAEVIFQSEEYPDAAVFCPECAAAILSSTLATKKIAVTSDEVRIAMQKGAELSFDVGSRITNSVLCRPIQRTTCECCGHR
jgi:hypothetical protein